jgi:hypothetical protein
MEIKALTDKDVGKWIWYVPNHAKDDKSQWEIGKLKGFSNENKRAWVVFHANGNWDLDHWKDYTGQAVSYENLNWNNTKEVK